MNWKNFPRAIPEATTQCVTKILLIINIIFIECIKKEALMTKYYEATLESWMEDTFKGQTNQDTATKYQYSDRGWTKCSLVKSENMLYSIDW